MAGANEQKLREHLASSRVWQVLLAESQWRQGAQALEDVAKAIEEARPLARENLGQHTADQADKAFVAMHEKVKQRQEQLKKGAEALASAKQAINRAQAVVSGFERDGDLHEPAPPDWSDDEVKQIQQLKAHGSRMTAYNSAVAAREEAAMAAIQDADSTNQTSTATMREIQGKPPLDHGGGGGGSTPGAGGSTAPPTGTTTPPDGDPSTYDPPTGATHDPPTGGTSDPPTYDPPTGGVDDPPMYDPVTGEPATGEAGPGAPTVLTTPSSGSFGGMAGAIGGGLAGGAIGMGAIRAGGALGGATPASGARPIGSTARSAAPGALGRGAASGGTPVRGSGAAVRGAGAGAGAGRGPVGSRGAGGRGAAGAAGGRGAGGRGAGGRGAGAGAAGAAAGRSRQGTDERDPQVDHLHDDQDWIDDEDGAPGVID
ncbi:hypothetical protein [Nocardioides sp.]|uniref:hypothetical protein n=1 Tax=Nocardioides sp. TaxID=35761 RepID=UPI002ED4A33F